MSVTQLTLIRNVKEAVISSSEDSKLYW